MVIVYNALLVDDEKTILETLRNTIAWNQFGFDEVFVAADANKALAIMEDNRIDLLITDIHMPNMNGLEFLKLVRRSHPHTHCIILTAYNEFEYARKAISLGVENFLLKPIETEEIENTIEKAVDNIYTKQNNNEMLFRNNILLRWATGKISNEELSMRSGMLNINIYLPQYCVICMRKRQGKKSFSGFRTQVVNTIADHHEVYRFNNEKGRFVLIVGGRNMDTDKMIRKLQDIATDLEIRSDIALSIGPMVNSSDSLSLSYQMASNMIESADLSGSDLTVVKESNFKNHEDDVLAKEIHTIYMKDDKELRTKEYKNISDKLLKNTKHCGNNEVISVLYHAILRVFLLEFPKEEDIPEQIQNRTELFTANLTGDKFSSSVIDLLDYTYLLFKYYFENFSPIIQATITYIHDNYSDSLSIKDFSNKNNMSSAYLGYLFKNETGMFFNNYLTQYRISCAINLLKNTDIQINEISDQIGFSSTSYFISCFKKQTGLSPKQYRGNQNNEKD